jgi:hypothetical protein
MKYSKFLLLALCLTSVTVQAETLDVSGSQGNAGAAGTVAKACVKGAVIKRNSGTLVTGLTTAKFKPFSVIETSFIPTTGAQVNKTFSVTYSLTASTAPVQAGVYDFCITPTGVGNVWKKPPNVGHFYDVEAVILGAVAADNGVVSVTFH